MQSLGLKGVLHDVNQCSLWDRHLTSAEPLLIGRSQSLKQRKTRILSHNTVHCNTMCCRYLGPRNIPRLSQYTLNSKRPLSSQLHTDARKSRVLCNSLPPAAVGTLVQSGWPLWALFALCAAGGQVDQLHTAPPLIIVLVFTSLYTSLCTSRVKSRLCNGQPIFSNSK